MENIKLFQGDCLEIMKQLPNKTIDMILCDLPYGTTNCKWDTIIPFEEMWNQYNRIIKNNGAILLFSCEPFTSELIHSNIKNFKYRWTWEKGRASNFLNAKKQPLRITEDICVFYKKQPTYNPQLRDREKKHIRNSDTYFKTHEGIYNKQKDIMKFNEFREIPTNKGYPFDLIKFSNIGNFGGKRLHPTQKPVALLEYLIKTYTNENDIVLDNCMGSGSTGVACKHLNRQFIGIELDEKYFEIAKERIESG